MRRTIVRTVAILVVVVIAAFTYPGAILVSIAVHLTPALRPSAFPVTPGGLEWLHVEHAPGSTPSPQASAATCWAVVLLRSRHPNT